MAARYWVLCDDELMAGPLQLPTCLRTVEQGAATHNGGHWWLFEDDDAPETLNGTRVDLLLERVGDDVRIAGRRPAL